MESRWKKAAQIGAAVALIGLAIALRMLRHEPKVAVPVSIVVGVVFALAIGLLLKERVRRDGARGWWAVLATVGVPIALMGHILFWGTHVVLEHRYPLAMGLAVGGTLAVAVAFRQARNARLSRVLGGLGAISLAAKLLVMPPMVPIRGAGDEVRWMQTPWTDLGILIPALGVLVVVVVIARPMPGAAGGAQGLPVAF